MEIMAQEKCCLLAAQLAG